jgi:uncharacterized protein YcgI (DUF1989 family)
MMATDPHLTPPPYGPKSYQLLHLSDEGLQFYKNVAENLTLRKKATEFVVPARSGKAFTVDHGQLLRVACHENTQVADFDVFNRENPKEQFSASQSRAIHGSHLSSGDRLWSHAIYQRPMMTIVADTVGRGRTSEGAKSHDLLFGPCDERLYRRATGKSGMPNCRDNLAKAIAEFGLTPEDVHDPLNIFMLTGLDEQGRLFYRDPVAKRGDYMEFYADMDCLCAISACPGKSSGPNPGGLKVEIYDIAAKSR